MLLLAGNILLNRVSKEVSYFALQLQDLGVNGYVQFEYGSKLKMKLGSLRQVLRGLVVFIGPLAKVRRVMCWNSIEIFLSWMSSFCIQRSGHYGTRLKKEADGVPTFAAWTGWVSQKSGQ
jgi:hypothetical protein